MDENNTQIVAEQKPEGENVTTEYIKVLVTRYGMTKGFRRGIYFTSFFITIVGMVLGLSFLVNAASISSDGFTLNGCVFMALGLFAAVVSIRCGAKVLLSDIGNLIEKINEGVLQLCIDHQIEIEKMKGEKANPNVPHGTKPDVQSSEDKE